MTDFKRIPPEQAHAMRNAGAVIVDIRDPHSFANGHISGSRHLDNHSLPDFIAAADLDHPLIVTCYHGHSSQSAAAYLVNQGFSEVYSLDGGFELWRHTYPSYVENDEQQEKIISPQRRVIRGLDAVDSRTAAPKTPRAP